MILDALLAFGIVMSSSTQMQVPFVGMTIGELSLLIWVLLRLWQVISGQGVVFTPAVSRLFCYWLIFALTLCVGAINGYMSKVLYLSYVVHDSLAYMLLAAISCLLASQPNAAQRIRRSAWWMTAFATITLAYQATLGWGLLHQSNITPWFWDRFQGWSKNPNQLALYCAAYGPIALYLASTSKTKTSAFLGYAGMVLPFIAGRMTKSDTYLFSTIMAALVFIGLGFWTWISTAGRNPTFPRQIAILLLITAVPMTLVLEPLVSGELSYVVSTAKSLTRDKEGLPSAETSSRRLQLWNEAVVEGLRSASIGYGPGPQLQSRPRAEPYYAGIPFEAHNTFLDLYIQGGMIATFLFMWLGGTALAFSWRAHHGALVALIACLAVFCFPHLIIRHPIVWFSLTLCLVTGYAPAVTRISMSRKSMTCAA